MYFNFSLVLWKKSAMIVIKVSNGSGRNYTGGVFHVCCKAYFLERTP